MDLLGRMLVAVGADAVEGPCRIAHEACVEAEIAGHPRRRLHAVIGGGTADHERADAASTQALLQVGADEGAVDALDDYGLARLLARLVLDGIAGTRPQGRPSRVRVVLAG